MARWQGRRPEPILRLLDAEVRRHPDLFDAHRLRWEVLGGGTVVDSVRGAVEQEGLRRRFPDDPEAWLTSAMSAPDRGDRLREVLLRFPGWSRADEAQYAIALTEQHREQDPAAAAAALRTLIRRFPDSPYRDEAYLQLLRYLAKRSPAAALRMADSLMTGQRAVSWSAVDEARQHSFFYTVGGRQPAGLAYSVRFELAAAAGDTAETLAVARRLLAAALDDPEAYRFCAWRLAGRDTLQLVEPGRLARLPLDADLARRLLRRGLAAADPRRLVGSPGYVVPADLPDPVRAEEEAQQVEAIRRHREWMRDLLRQLDAEAAAVVADRGAGGDTLASQVGSP